MKLRPIALSVSVAVLTALALGGSLLTLPPPVFSQAGQKYEGQRQKDDGQKNQRDDGQQNQKDDGQKNQKDDGQQNQKDDGQRNQRDEGQKNQSDGAK